MKTIKGLIAAGIPGIEAQRRIARDETVFAVYQKYPELADMDRQIVKVRKNRLVAVIDKDDRLIKRLDDEESELEDKRDLFLRANYIDPDFDLEKSICTKCDDTGFVRGRDGTLKVCSCKSDELDECYESCGLGDYTSFTMKNYRDDYLGDSTKRSTIKKELLKIMLGVGESEEKPLWVYSAAPQTGKTYLAVCIVKTAISLGKSACYIKCENLDQIGEDTAEDLKNFDLVVIDDFAGEVTLSGGIGSVINGILEVRNASGLRTILVSAFPMADLVKSCDMRVSGKLNRAGSVG